MGKSKKSSKNSGLYWYMQAIMPDLRREGRVFPNGLRDVAVVASPRWQMMTSAEREPYENRAREEKRKNKGQRSNFERMDTLGNVIALREDPEKLFAQKRETDRVKEKEKWPLGQELIHQKFYLISFEYLCEFETAQESCPYKYMPREVGVIEWSMQLGITKQLHYFIAPGDIPLGYRFTADDHSQRTHQIPVVRFQHDDDNYLGMWLQIQNFINPSDEKPEAPPLYCLSHEHEMVSICLDWVSDHTQTVCAPLQLSVLEDMVQDLYTAVGHSVSQTSVYDLLMTTTFDYEPMTRCKFHEDLGIPVCALGKVKRCVYSMADSLVDIYDFTLTTSHVPDPNGERPLYTVIAPAAAPTHPHPSTNQSRSSSGPFASRDIRYANQNEDQDSDSEEEAFKQTFNPRMPEYKAREDDFPSLGGASSSASHPAVPGVINPRAPGPPPAAWVAKAAAGASGLQRPVTPSNVANQPAAVRQSRPAFGNQSQPVFAPPSLRPAFVNQSQPALRPAFGGQSPMSGPQQFALRQPQLSNPPTRPPRFVPPGTQIKLASNEASGQQLDVSSLSDALPGNQPTAASGDGNQASGPQFSLSAGRGIQQPASLSQAVGRDAGRQQNAPQLIRPVGIGYQQGAAAGRGSFPVGRGQPFTVQPGASATNIGIGRGLRPAFIPPPQGAATAAVPAPAASASAAPAPAPTTMPFSGVGRGQMQAKRPPPGFGIQNQ